MTIHNIKMPDIGEGIAEVELVAWRVAVGDSVVEDQILADVMTDKATVEIPSHVSGTVLSLDAAVGQVVAVGTPIIHIETAVAQVDQGQVAMPIEAPVAIDVVRVSSSPAVVAASLPTQPRPSAAPAVRRRAAELGLDLAQISPTGSTGHITHADLERQTGCSQKESELPMLHKGQLPLDAIKNIPVIGLRRKIAQKMQEAKRRIPHFTYVEEVDVTELEALRAQLNSQHAATRGHLTLLPLLVRALVLALREFPEVNARYDDDAGVITQYAALHLGLATQSDGGLMVPVIRHAEALDLWACAAQISRLAQAARSGQATRDELTGSTLTLTSLGALGGIVSTPIINHPEVAIVGTNRIVERPVILGGAVVARKMMNLSSSFDHRVVDGHTAARFIQRVRSLLQCPATLFVD